MDVTIDGPSNEHTLQHTLKEAGRSLRDALDTMKDINTRPQVKIDSLTNATRSLRRAGRVAHERCSTETAAHIAQAEADARAAAATVQGDNVRGGTVTAGCLEGTVATRQ